MCVCVWLKWGGGRSTGRGVRQCLKIAPCVGSVSMHVWCWLKSEPVHAHPPTAHTSQFPAKLYLSALFFLKKKVPPPMMQTCECWSHWLSLGCVSSTGHFTALCGSGRDKPPSSDSGAQASSSDRISQLSFLGLYFLSLHPHPLTCIFFERTHLLNSDMMHTYARLFQVCVCVCLCGRTQCMPRAGLKK